MMDETAIKEIKKWLASIVESTVNETTQTYCGLQKMQAVDFMSRAVQDLANHILMPHVTLLHEIDTNFLPIFTRLSSVV